MALYNISNKILTPLQRTTFSNEGLQERYDIQEAIKNNIDILAPDCLVIAEEFSDWEDSRRRIDILAIDKQANLVVIELKRDEIGAHMELQALRYAAMISTMSFSKACEYYQAYISRNNLDLDAKEKILDFVELQDTDLVNFGKDVRIILASAGFSKELTTTAIWLRDKGVDISCVKITPYSFKGETLINAEQIIPVPELNEYQVKFREKRTEQIASAKRSEKDYSNYQYKGLILNKRNLALEIFTDWIENNKPANFDELKKQLNGVIKNRTIALAELINEERRNRYHMNDDDLIELESGEVIAISNQWGIGNIERVLGFFRQEGFVVEKVEID
ncbi:membrane protein [Pantoea sp. At-9b]|uniref:membrane protein n=1 Tax=Pantoea sp. (strain At-9b) TaxID=592316 RepID=UPI0001B409E7|nr:membrane protein [Pantoea sp. At-9b]ADU72471.1 putative inner membrane protein [Pantoea sp. At-9b]